MPLLTGKLVPVMLEVATRLKNAKVRAVPWLEWTGIKGGLRVMALAGAPGCSETVWA